MSSSRGVGDFIFILWTQVLSKLRGFLLVPLMLRVMGPSEYGLWVELILAISLVVGIAQANLHTALLRYLPTLAQEEHADLFWTGSSLVLVGSVVASAGLYGLAPLLADALRLPVWGLRLVAGVVIARSHMQYASNYFRATESPRIFAILDTLPLFTELIVVIVAVALGQGLRQMLTGMLVLEAAAALACLAAVAASLPLRRPTWGSLKRMVTYSLPSLPISLSSSLLMSGDRYAIGAMLGAEAVGIYSAAYTLGSLPFFFVRPLTVTLLPRAAKLWDAGEHGEAGRMLRRNVKIYLLLAVPAAVGIAVLGPVVLPMMGGMPHPEWNAPLLLSIAVGTTLFGLLWLGLHVLHLEEKTGYGAGFYVFGAAVNLGLNFVLLPRFGLIGAGLATALAYGAVCVPIHLRARSLIGGLLDTRAAAGICASAAIMGAAIGWFRPTTVPAIAGTVGLGLGVFSLAARMFKVLSHEEIGMVRQGFAGLSRRGLGGRGAG